MKNMIITVGIILSMSSYGFGQDEIKGVWITPDGDTKVEIYQKDSSKYHGKIVWIKGYNQNVENPPKDRMNPDKSLRGREIMGMDLLEDLVYDEGEWSGTIYVPKKGRTLDAILTLENTDQINMNVSFRGFSRTRKWQRAEDAE